MMEFLIKSSFVLAIIVSTYYIFLQKETHFKSIRIFFLLGFALTFILPLIEFPIYIEHEIVQTGSATYNSIISKHIGDFSLHHYQDIFPYVYLSGLALFGIIFLHRLISLGRLLINNKSQIKDGIHFIETNKNIAPFSFFNFIVFNPSQFSISELNHILAHEKVHIKQWHSLDKILANILIVTFWFNPLVWLLKKSVDQNLEFLTDATTVKEIDNSKSYQYTILKTCGISFQPQITSSFFNGLTKKRISLINKRRSSKLTQLKFLIAIPFIVFLLSSLNTNTIAQSDENNFEEFHKTENNKEHSQESIERREEHDNSDLEHK